MQIAELLETCEAITSVTSANGSFQRHVAYDVSQMGMPLAELTVGEFVELISAAQSRFNRLFLPVTDIPLADLAWCADFFRSLSEGHHD